jgi:NAD(P)-dependent dehydrogenase (short-subunit alcohol dehydrogenase family)
MLFQGQVVLVSGAAQGLGAVIATAFAASGAKVIAVDMNGPAVASAAKKIREEGGQCIAFALDVRDAAACYTVVKQAAGEIGAISVLVNNAGITSRASLDDAALNDEIDRVISVNLKGVLNLTKACLPYLTETKGVVVNVASIASLIATFASIPYGASKGAVGQATKYLARDLAPLGIRVNAVAPGFVTTPLTSGPGHDARMQKSAARTMMKRVATPEEIAGPVLFLASTMSQYITGVILPVDGGYTAN